MPSILINKEQHLLRAFLICEVIVCPASEFNQKLSTETIMPWTVSVHLALMLYNEKGKEIKEFPWTNLAQLGSDVHL
jgi:hypothetical protein